MRPRPRTQPWAGFPPPVPPPGGPSTQPSGHLSGTGTGPAYSGVLSDQPELLMQQLTDAAALSGSHAGGVPGTPGGTAASSHVTADAAWAAAAAATNLSSASNVLVGIPAEALSRARLQTGYPQQQPGAWMQQPYPGHDQQAAAAAVAAWGMPMVRAASTGDLRMAAAQGGVVGGVAAASQQQQLGYGSTLPPMAPRQYASAAAAGPGGGWRLPPQQALDLSVLPPAGMVGGMGGRPHANSLLLLPGGGLAARARRGRSNSYTYGGYADMIPSLGYDLHYAGAGAGVAGGWADTAPYGGYLLSPASTADSASTGGGAGWQQQAPPPPVSTPRHTWQLGQQQQQVLHAQGLQHMTQLQALAAQQQQALLLQQGLQAGPYRGGGAAASVVDAAAAGNTRRRRHSVCMGDPRLQLGHHRSRRLSGMRGYGPLMLEMQPWSEVSPATRTCVDTWGKGAQAAGEAECVL